MSRMGSILLLESSEWDHWVIMPCHDKKLEASRQDSVLDDEISTKTTHAVDLVITTQELVELVEEWLSSQNPEDSMTTVADYLSALQPARFFCLSTPDDVVWQIAREQPTLITISSKDTLSFQNNNNNTDEGGEEAKNKQVAFSSGGHADLIFRYAAKQLFQSVEWKPAKGNTRRR
jgi:iron only hydrogenase large subunit-like protein